jgi:hypothetical protein
MPTGPRQLPVGPQPDAAARRLHIHGIKEMPAGYDAEVAELFRDLRSATALTEMDLATRLGTRPDVVQALEQGALYALPPWAETCRVVNAYGALLNLDVRPLLRRIYAQLEAGIVELQPKAMPDVPVMTPPENGDFGYASANSGGTRPNPLDIPWPPPDTPQRQQPRPAPQQSWQNAGAPPQAAPQAPRPNAGISLSRKMPGRKRSRTSRIRKAGLPRNLKPPPGRAVLKLAGPLCPSPVKTVERLSRARSKANRLSPSRRRRGKRRRRSPSISRRRNPSCRSMRISTSLRLRRWPSPRPSPSGAGRRC